MKKFTTILFALFVLIGVNAADWDAKSLKVAGRTPAIVPAEAAFANMPNRAPQAEQATYNYTIGTLRVYTNYLEEGYIVYDMIDVDYTRGFQFAIYVEDGESDVEIGRTYTIRDMEAAVTYVQSATSLTTASFTKTLLDDGRVKIIASGSYGTGRQATTYNLTYEEEITIAPTGETINVVITEPVEATFYNESGDWQFEGENEEYYVSLDIYTGTSQGPDEGIFFSDDDDFDLSYTFLLDIENNQINPVTVEAAITKNGKKYAIEAVILGKDGIVYNISMVYDGSVLTYDNTTADFIEDFENYDVTAHTGYLSVIASNDNSGYISLQVYASELKAGVYPINDTKAANTVLASVGVANGYIQPSFAGYQSENGQFSINSLWFLVEGTVTVAADGSVVIDALNSAGRAIKANFGAPLPEHLQYEENADIEIEFPDFDIEAGNGYIGIYAENDDLFVAELVLVTSAGVLPAGTFPINDTQANNTVLASTGFVSGTGVVMPSALYSLIEEDGEYYYNRFWFLVSGSVTIDNDNTITVDALNSLNRSVKATLRLAGAPDAISNTNAEAVAAKRIENGALIIQRNGRTYNAVGALIR